MRPGELEGLTKFIQERLHLTPEYEPPADEMVDAALNFPGANHHIQLGDDYLVLYKEHYDDKGQLHSIEEIIEGTWQKVASFKLSLLSYIHKNPINKPKSIEPMTKHP